tara:strand:+ start:65 stop:526 length:462 start_codon:yes stop_codon:yes gene_type:complete
MFKKVFSFITVLFLLTSCGYTPMFSNLEKNNIFIEIQNVEGDRTINNLIKKRLLQYQKNINAEKKYKIEILSDYNKLIITKDAAGVITNYRLTADVSFKINYNDSLKTIIFKEKFDIKKGDSLFEEQNYENLIKQDIANLIVQKFIFQLLSIK